MSSDYKELYKKYRPRNWDDIVGQGPVVNSLKTAVKNDSIPTAYGFFGSHGCGKALHKDTIIPTPDGFRKMGDIEIGDFVLGSNSQPVKVLDKYCPNDPVSYSLSFDDDTVVRASAGHLWEVKTFGGSLLEEGTVLTTQEMFDSMKNTNFRSFYTIKLRSVDSDNTYHEYNNIFEDLGFSDFSLAARFVDVFLSEMSDKITWESDSSSYCFSVPGVFPELDNIVSVMRSLGGIVIVDEALDGIEIDWFAIPDNVVELLSLSERNRKEIAKERIVPANLSHHIIRIDRINDNPSDYFCISVDSSDKLFLCTESFIPTHNTSTARVLAKALNCMSIDDNSDPCNICDACQSIEDGTSLDVTYRSMANAGSTDDVRELCKQAMLQPTGKKSIYILDEVHNLSKAAFDALLIPLEDYSMPSLFILCSTAPEKIPATVLSRIQTRNFTPIKNGEMLSFINNIVEKESLDLEDKILKEIVRRGRGSARDTLTMLEKYISEGDFSSIVQNEMDFAKTIVKELFKYNNDLTCTVKVFEELDKAEKSCDLENLLVHIFKVARTYIINLENRDKKSIGFRQNAFSFLQDLMILSSDALDKSRRSNGLDIRVFLDNVIVSLIRKHPLS